MRLGLSADQKNSKVVKFSKRIRIIGFDRKADVHFEFSKRIRIIGFDRKADVQTDASTMAATMSNSSL